MNVSRTVFRDVRVFGRGGFGDPSDVVVVGGVVVSIAPSGDADDHEAAEVVAGGYLLPGLIDAHVHLDGDESLGMLADHGVTTALDMGSPAGLIADLRGTPGVTDFRSALMVATSPASAHARNMHLNDEALVGSAADADAWVAAHAEAGADYIKIVIDLPGFEQADVDALVEAAHARGLRTIAHASRADAVAMGQRAGVDVLTHVPLDRPVQAAQAHELSAAGTVLVPTLVMMRTIVDRVNPSGGPGPRYEAARDSVAAARAAGMPIVAGTDANRTPAAPASPPFGASLHDELELLVDAGLSTTEALESATSVAAATFGLTDRGRIEPGTRADLVLLDADPTADIRATRTVRGVWLAGVRR